MRTVRIVVAAICMLVFIAGITGLASWSETWSYGAAFIGFSILLYHAVSKGKGAA